MKYCVTVAMTGCIFVEADSEVDAMYITDHQVTDSVHWSDNWEVTDCMEDDSALDYMYIKESAFD